MHRLTVALLAAFDAFVGAAVGLVAILAPLTVLWAVSLRATEWGGLWPTVGAVWQLGHHVPQAMTLPIEMLVATRIAPEAGTFIVSLAPLAFFAFTVWSGARSGVRAARAGAWLSGVLSGGLVFCVIAVAVEMTSHTPLASSPPTLAILLPTAAYLIPMLIAAIIRAWIDGDGGLIDALHDLVDGWSTDWAEVPALAVRGIGVVLLGLTAISATVIGVITAIRGGNVVALYQASGVDAMGAVVIALATLAYVPTLMVWTLAWLAGPGFILGTGATVSPAATHLGVLPGLPPLGLVPELSATWLLVVVLLPIGVGVFAGYIVRSRYAAVLGDGERYAPRIVLAGTIAAGSAGIMAVVFILASGSIGPGRMADFGVSVALVTLALLVEVGIGAAIMLLLPRGDDEFSFDEQYAGGDTPRVHDSDGLVDDNHTLLIDDGDGLVDNNQTVPIGDGD